MDLIGENIANGKYENKVPYPSFGLPKEERLDALHAYIAGQGRMTALFKQDALAYLGLTDHPKADLLFSKAWQEGHAHGYQEVWNAMVDLAELLE